MMKLVKLKRNYNGHDRFTHRIEFIPTYGKDARILTQKQWNRVREWLWMQFGPSAEQWLARPEYMQGKQPIWAWDADKSVIYVADAAVQMFVLKKEFWDNEENL